ncbi:disulfide bond formation protein DsbA [Occultella glacieicola]|uniref:Disulfide bond formation protein DsbA n=1 Tax=Occultella glacieicola TaxID=2518684 RepID=A0ABY2E3K7_9MICO|nr:thioredoxin domain-containing protein [Occultella glacieicola]TDE94209.1 disulfide bond formation protein DsbA [Occultella glacieicola]
MAAKGSKSTAASARDRGRAEAERIRAETARGERRTRILLVSGAVALIALIVVAGFFIAQAANKSYLEDVEVRPANSDLHGGISVGADGVAGTENSGAPVLDVYLDFMCPHCVDFEAVNAADLTEMREAGDLTVVYHPVAVVDPGNGGASQRSAVAAAAVANYAPEQFAAFTGAVFAFQEQELVSLSDSQLAEIAAGAGVPQDAIDTFTDGQYPEWVEAATNQMQRDTDNRSTPQVLLDGEPLDVDWTEPGVLRGAIESASDGS